MPLQAILPKKSFPRQNWGPKEKREEEERDEEYPQSLSMWPLLHVMKRKMCVRMIAGLGRSSLPTPMIKIQHLLVFGYLDFFKEEYRHYIYTVHSLGIPCKKLMTEVILPIVNYSEHLKLKNLTYHVFDIYD